MDDIERQIVRQITELAQGLVWETVAEWMEDEATLRLVQELEVGYAQRYHIGKLVPVLRIGLGIHNPIWIAVKTRIKSGAAEGIRTPNPRITSAALFR